MKHLGRKLLLPVAAVALASGSFAFLASNSFAGPNNAGSGETTISGYAVSQIHYTIDTGHDGPDSEYATNVASVSFKLDRQADPSNVSALITSPSNDKGDTNTDLYGNCTTTSATVGNEAPAGSTFTCGPTTYETRLSGALKLVVNAAS